MDSVGGVTRGVTPGATFPFGRVFESRMRLAVGLAPSALSPSFLLGRADSAGSSVLASPRPHLMWWCHGFETGVRALSVARALGSEP
jgi:hypothetical protein